VRVRAGVRRCLEEAFIEGLFLQGVGIAQNSGNQSSDCVTDHQRSELPTGQDIVPDRDDFIDQVIGYATIHALIVATHNHDMRLPRERAGSLLSQGGGRWVP
jgi:hypothetical protein